MLSPLTIRTESEGDRCVFMLSGIIDENAPASLARLAQQAPRHCAFNFRDVRAVNSSGVRGWMLFLRDFQLNRQIDFEECPIIVTMQVNMIPGFLGQANVRSLFIPFVCPTCDHEQLLLMHGPPFPQDNDEVPKTLCGACGRQSEIEPDEDFFAFTRR